MYNNSHLQLFKKTSWFLSKNNENLFKIFENIKSKVNKVNDELVNMSFRSKLSMKILKMYLYFIVLCLIGFVYYFYIYVI